VKSTISKRKHGQRPVRLQAVILIMTCIAAAFVFPAPSHFFPASVALAQGVTESFNKARRLFEQGKLRASYKILAGLAKKYPDHQPTQILMGRILFKAGKINAAAKRFRRLSADSISPDFAYEYGIVMFSDKQCDRAQAGFARVPANSKLAPLANFYRGVCYVRGQDWQKAYKYLRKAKGLPGNLEQTRRQALSQVQKQLSAERSGAVGSGSNPYIIVPTPPPPVYQSPAYGPPDSPAPPPPDNKPPPPPPPPPTGFSTSLTPAIVYTQISRSEDFHSTGVKDSQIRKTEIKLGFKTKYSFAPRSFGAQPYFTLPIDLAQVNTGTKGAKVTYVAYENDPGSIIEQQTGAEDATSNALETKVGPEFGYPVTSSVDLAAGYSMKDSYADMKADKKSSTLGPYGSLALNGDSWNIKGSGSSTDSVNTDGKTTKTVTVLGVTGTKDFDSTSVTGSYQQTEATSTIAPAPGALSDFLGTTTVMSLSGTKNWETFSMTAAFNDTTYATPSPLLIKINEQQKTVMELSANKTFDFGGSMTLTVQQNTLSGYKKVFDDKNAAATEDPKPKVVISANGTEQVVLTTFKLNPLSWLSGSLSYRYVMASYSQSNPDYQKDFITSVADLTNEFTMVVSVSTTF
jgi:tetratricopeptide (TPR) repeat protein